MYACTVRLIDDSKLYKIINKNRYNLISGAYTCEYCKTYSQLESSSISLIDEEEFISNPDKYIDNAYEKCVKQAYLNLSKQRKFVFL